MTQAVQLGPGPVHRGAVTGIGMGTESQVSVRHPRDVTDKPVQIPHQPVAHCFQVAAPLGAGRVLHGTTTPCRSPVHQPQHQRRQQRQHGKCDKPHGMGRGEQTLVLLTGEPLMQTVVEALQAAHGAPQSRLPTCHGHPVRARTRNSRPTTARISRASPSSTLGIPMV